MANNSSLSRRAALRQQQEMDERNKRNKRILGAAAVLAGVVVVVVLAIVIYQAIAGNRSVAEDQLTPPNATDNYGILVNGEEPTEDKPHLVIWEDFQCPACKDREEAYGPIVEQLVEQGEITTEVRTAYFLDGQRSDGPSQRAAVAAAAADEVGYYGEYHDLLYANQAGEGVGYPDSQLRDELPVAAGMQGEDLERFQELYDSRAFQDFVRSAHDKFNEDRIGATPTYLVSGEKLEFFDQERQQVLIQPSADDLLRAIDEAWEAGGQNNEG